MLDPPAQKTCSIAAHSASAQVITIASDAGSVLEELLISFGAVCPTWLKSIAGSAGVFFIVGEKLFCAVVANIREGLYLIMVTPPD
jgi:hypothetical protein